MPSLFPASGLPSRSLALLSADEVKSLTDARDIVALLAGDAAVREESAYEMADEAATWCSPSERARIRGAAGDEAALGAIISERVAYVSDGLDARDSQRARSVTADAAHKTLSAAHKRGEVQFDEVRQAGNVALAEYDLLEFMHADTERFKALTAEAVALREKAREPLPQYVGNDLNGHMFAGPYATGVGGSDIAAILKIGSPSSAEDRYVETLAYKAGLARKEPLDVDDYSSPAARGVVWEGAILRMLQDRHPERRLVQTGTLWRSRDWEHGVAALDGLWVDDSGAPVGIVEAKYASDVTQWGDPADGLDAVPANYRAQALWYSLMTGLDRGTLVVLIDDRELRTYDYEIDGDMRDEQAAMMDAAKTFWEDGVEPARERGSLPAKRGYSAGSIPKSALGVSWNKGRETFLANVMGYRDQTREEVIAAHEAILDGRSERSMSQDERREALKRLYTDFDLAQRRRPVAMIDLEATGVSPRHSHIIETGLSVVRPERDSDGRLAFRETLAIDELHGLDRKASQGRGTGPEDVHHISVDMVQDRPEFRDPSVQRRVLDALLDAGTLFAQNATYEDLMLRQHLPGYAEARDDGRIGVCDTMVMSRHLDGDEAGVDSHSLGSIMRRYGMEYEGAHRAKADADMQVAALRAMADSGPAASPGGREEYRRTALGTI